jgi:pilus assembly protein FimV
MHLRKLILVSGFASALLSNMAAALGLGEVRLNSTLNEPLSAEIKLLDTRGLSASQIMVGLASPADYERNGVDRLYFFTEFQFEVLLNHPGGAIVKITSHNPVREPYLNFLVEARWPTGRLLREYTLLMDLPTFSESASKAPALSTRAETSATAPVQSEPRQRPRQTASTSQSSASTSQSSVRLSGGFEGDSYRVGARDTLWQIALDVRPDASHSVHQTMLAIQRLNPDAFINGNINLLRQGQVLRIPTSADIKAVSAREAVNEVARQNRAWSENDMGAQLSAARRETRAARESEAISGSVKLATPSRDNAEAGQGSGDNAGRGRALESELAASLEELDKTRSENLELSARVKELEDQIQTMERLVDISNEQLRALQLGIKQSEAQSEAQAEADSGYADSSYADPTGSFDEVSTQETAESPADDVVAPAEPETVAPAVAQTPAPQTSVVIPPKPEKTLVDQLMENIQWIGAGLVALLALIGLLIYRNKKKAVEEEFAEGEDLFDSSSEFAEEEYEESAGDDLQEESEDPLDAFDEESHAEAETEDVVGEADIYIAYGKLDQAEEMLLNGLEREPNSIDIRLKLLEVYSQAQDATKFDKHYASLIGVAGQASLARAAELRSHIDGIGEFDPAADAVADVQEELAGIDLSEADDAIDLGEDLTDESSAAADDDLEFSFDLDDGEAATPLMNEASLTDEQDLRTGGSSYDLSFDNEPLPSAKTAAEDDLSFDFELEDEPVAEQPVQLAETEEAPIDFDSDALEFSLEDDESALSLDTELELADEEAAPAAAAEADDFSFEFETDNESPSGTAIVADEELSLSLDEAFEEQVSELDTALSDAVDEIEEAAEDLPLADQADDFNLDMEIGDLDLAALDQEMQDLDADLGDLDFDAGEAATDLVEATDSGADLEEAMAEEEPPLVAEAADDLGDLADLELAGEEDVFDEALAGLTDAGLDTEELPDLDDAADEDGDLDFLADADEAATKLDLARAYIDMGDADGARDILSEVAQEGNEEQRREAAELLSRIDA